MNRYLVSVIMGFLVAILLVVLMPIVALMAIIAGLCGTIKVNEG